MLAGSVKKICFLSFYQDVLGTLNYQQSKRTKIKWSKNY